MPGTVLHVIERFGAPSETFIDDRMWILQRLGWRGWVAAAGLHPQASPGSIPEERVILARRSRWPVEALRSAARARSPGAGWWVRRAIAEVEPQIVHAHFGWSGLLAHEAAVEAGVPLVVGLHGYDVTVFPRWGFDPPDGSGGSRQDGDVYRELFRDAAAVVVVSRYLEGRLRELGYGRPIEVIPSGIRLDRFPFREPLQTAPRLALIFIGRLVPYKGLDHALRAVASLRDSAEVTLEVIGDGPERLAAERLSERLGIAGRVSFRGAVDRERVAAALAASDILLAPSTSVPSGQAEGLGNVVKEAMATGVQVVATRSGGLPELFPAELAGELVEPGDPEALAAAVERLAADRRCWGDRARLARSWVEREFDWTVVGARLADLYETCGRRAR